MRLDDVDDDQVAALAREMAGYGPIALHLSPDECLTVIGHLQLALRHPDNTGFAAIQARDLVERIAGNFGPRFRALVEAGWSA